MKEPNIAHIKNNVLIVAECNVNIRNDIFINKKLVVFILAWVNLN